MSEIRDFHAHVYFDQQTIDQARALCESAAATFGVKMGTVHQKPVGPHPDWSCQLTITREQFGTVVPWLALHRDGLNVLVHPQTDDDLLDHTDYAMWLGEVRPLSVDMFKRT